MSLHHTHGPARNTGRHQPGGKRDRLIPAHWRVPAGWTPNERAAGRATVTADDTAVPCLPPDINLAEVTR